MTEARVITELAWRVFDHRRALEVHVVFQNGNTARYKRRFIETVTYEMAMKHADEIIREEVFGEVSHA